MRALAIELRSDCSAATLISGHYSNSGKMPPPQRVTPHAER